MKLPVVAGFIFPDGKRIETAGIGHIKMAYQYIRENNLIEQWKKSALAEDDFLIEKIGCAKIASYDGKKYIYIPQNHNWYISGIKRNYVDAGYKPIYCYGTILSNGDRHKIRKDYIYSGFSYNQTVIPKVLKDGSVQFMYNPEKIGD